MTAKIRVVCFSNGMVCLLKVEGKIKVWPEFSRYHSRCNHGKAVNQTDQAQKQVDDDEIRYAISTSISQIDISYKRPESRLRSFGLINIRI